MSTPTEPAAAPRTEAQIRADLEATRAALAASVDDLYEQLQPAAIVANTKAAACPLSCLPKAADNGCR